MLPNEELLRKIREYPREKTLLAVEMIASYGMPVGADVFETVLWIGRFIEAWKDEYRLIYRREVKIEICGTMEAKDANIRQALIDLFPRTGGGKTPQIGTKKDPGPLYGVVKDIWSALGVAVTTQRILNRCSTSQNATPA
ncbi:MAG: hypothetical protein D6698_07430 [Gammaproteobacteria bacterium]|nr:MAG: hypothetical protein D6698_07430 [Gammaproteobacteria bacterium]